MGQEDKEKILELIFEEPKEYTVREISKKTKIPRATVHKRLGELKKEEIFNKNNGPNHNLLFKTKKVNYFTEKIIKSGLIDEIIDKLNPSCIILFGSFRKGESDKDSDIDLFVESSLEKELNLKNFESELNHKIQIHLYSDINKVNKNLMINIINGIKLYGSFSIK